MTCCSFDIIHETYILVIIVKLPFNYAFIYQLLFKYLVQGMVRIGTVDLCIHISTDFCKNSLPFERLILGMRSASSSLGQVVGGLEEILY